MLTFFVAVGEKLGFQADPGTPEPTWYGVLNPCCHVIQQHTGFDGILAGSPAAPLYWNGGTHYRGAERPSIR